MGDLAAYGLLCLSALASATLLPGSSEAALLGLLAAGQGEPWLLVLVATAGNVAGSTVNWFLGRGIASVRDRRWFPVSPAALARAEGWYRRFGVATLLLAWVPVVGDPLTVVAGIFRTDLRLFLLLVTLGKAARYGLIVLVFLGWSA